ncbi:MAG TPA: ROK family transcriptional regulator [Chloroflexota bacterium]
MRALVDGANLKDVKWLNRQVVFHTLLRQQPLTRSELAAVTGLTRASITNIINEFLRRGLVRPAGPSRESRASRGAGPLRLEPRAGCAVGINVGRSRTQGAVLGLDGSVLAADEWPWDLREGVDRLLEHLQNSIDALLARVGSVPLIGIGVTAPGPFSVQTTARAELSAAPRHRVPYNWAGYPVGARLRERYGVPVSLENDANAATLAEQWLGAGREFESFAHLAVGTGIGAGAVLGRELYRGRFGVALELGHVTIDLHGPPCVCGNVGCLELYVALPATAARARRRLPELLGPLDDAAVIAWLGEAAGAMHPVALEIVDEVGYYLGVASVTIVNLLNPEAIIVGGLELGDLAPERLAAKVAQVVRERSFSVVADQVRVLPSALGKRGAVLGAGLLALLDFSPLQGESIEASTPLGTPRLQARSLASATVGPRGRDEGG